jgi:hypothetical protein
MRIKFILYILSLTLTLILGGCGGDEKTNNVGEPTLMDHLPPTLLAQSPTEDAYNLPLFTVVSASFDEQIAPLSVCTIDPPIPGTECRVNLSPDGKTITAADQSLNSISWLQGRKYTITFNEIYDTAGNQAQAVIINFASEGWVDLYQESHIPADYKIVFSDQFTENNIDINGSQSWSYRTTSASFDGGMVYNQADNVSIENGLLNIKYSNIESKSTGGGIISKKSFGYGYYEAKIRFYRGSGKLHQSFWTYSSTEIDGVELDSNYGALTNNVHRWLPDHQAAPYTGKVIDYDRATSMSDWQKVGFLYEPGRVVFYVNGVQTRIVSSQSFSGFPGFDAGKIYLTALPSATKLPPEGAQMQVDWILYAKSEAEYDVNLISNTDFSIQTSPSSIGKYINNSITTWLSGSLGLLANETLNTNDSRKHRNVIYSENDIDSNLNKWILQHKSGYSKNQAWNTNTYQWLHHLRNGNYYLHIRYKSKSDNPEQFNNVIAIKNSTGDVFKHALLSNTNDVWIDSYVGLDDNNNIDIATDLETLIITLRSKGEQLSDEIFVDRIGLYRRK